MTAIACVFQATKIEEHVLPIAKILELAKVNSRSLTWVKIPKELSFENNDWMTLWKVLFPPKKLESLFKICFRAKRS